jgi:hypothetical protein
MVDRIKAVSGIYRQRRQAERALDLLIARGIPCSSISVVLLAPAGAGVGDGGMEGGVIAGTIGILAGVGAVAVPGLGRMIGAGPVMAGLGAARPGRPEARGPESGLIRAFIGIGIPANEAERCEVLVRTGGTLLSLSCSSAEQVARAMVTLAGTGAIETTVEPGDARAT